MILLIALACSADPAPTQADPAPQPAQPAPTAPPPAAPAEPAPGTPTPPAPPETVSVDLKAPAAADFVFDRERCAHADLATMNLAELRLARNTVFALQGRPFQSADLQAYFGAFDWYSPDPDWESKLPKGEMEDGSDTECVGKIQMWETAEARMFQAAADMDGDGAVEPVAVLAHDPKLVDESDGSACGERGCTAHAILGESTRLIQFNWAAGAAHGEKEILLVDIEPADGRRELLVRHQQPDDEDPAWQTIALNYVDGALGVNTLDATGYSRGQVVVKGDGRLGVVDGDCAYDVTTWYALDGRDLKEAGQDKVLRPDAEQFKMADGNYGCPACPYVYLLGGEAPVFVGEILRNQIGPDRAAWNALRLPAEDMALERGEGSRVLAIRVAEEKPEVTWLDAIRLRAGGELIAPIDCDEDPGALLLSAPPSEAGASRRGELHGSRAPRAAHCSEDDRSLVIEPGEHVDLRFAIPAGVDLADGAWLEATGYYVPQPSPLATR